MTSILKVDTIQDQSGNNIINESGDTITIGASGDTITIPSGATISNLGTATGFGEPGIFESQLLHVRDEKSSGTNAGGFTSGSFLKRDLNTTLTNEISGASISSSVITLPAGTYYIFASAPACECQFHKAKLTNTTDSSDVIIGTSQHNRSDNNYAVSRSYVIGRFTIASSKNFELQHRCSVTRASDGLGLATFFSIVEVYTDVQIWKIA
jgi:hypothetical protein